MRFILSVFSFVLISSYTIGEDRIANRPAVPGKLRLHLRERPKKNEHKLVERIVEWDVAKTAIIVCDMWDDHYCKLSAQRVDVMVPKMNRVISAARSHGVMIIHAPSSTMDMYEGSPYRQRIKQAPKVKAPIHLNSWCHSDPEKEPPIPLGTKDGHCDDPVVGPEVKVFSKQHPGLDIIGFDGISDNGEEIYNYCEEQGITNIIMMGVHTNLCVLGRPFGIRKNVQLGRNIVLVRDLTDCMYDPRQPPFVSHARGTEIVVEHIEKFWCPSILSKDLLKVIPESNKSVRSDPL